MSPGRRELVTRVSAASATIFALLMISILPLFATAGPISYGHTWGTNDNERATAVVVDANGNVIIAGNQLNLTTFEQRGFVAKFSPSGNLLWNRVFPFDVNTSVDLSLAAGGDVYVLGMKTTSFSGPGPNGTLNNSIPAAFVARISSGGALVFAENITEIFLPLRIATDPLTGGFVVVGRGPSYVNGIVGAFTSTGSLRWARASATSAAPVSVAVDGSGRSFVLLDRSNGNSAVDAFDSNGTLLGQIVIGSYYTTPVYPTDLIVASGGPLVLGTTVNGLFLSQLSPSLGVSWTEVAQGVGWYDYPLRLVGLSDGTVEVLTQSASRSNYTYAANVYHVSSTGAFLDGSSYLSPASSQGVGPGFFLYAGAAMSNGAFVMAGLTLGPSPLTSSAVNVSSAPASVSWSADGLGWSAQNLTLNAITGSLLDPVVPVDNFSESAAYQAWYGVTNSPASKIVASVATSQSSSSSTIVSFSASVTGGRKPYNLTWSFGDGTFGTGATPTHTYPAAGRYLAQVTVVDSQGLTGYGSTFVTVTGPPVILSIQQYPSPAFAGNYVNFYAAALDPDGGGIASYAWIWGDGSSDTTTYNSAYHIYGLPGNYTMTLTVTDNDQGLSASTSRVVTVLPPVAVFSWYPPVPLMNSTVFFNAGYSYDPDGYIVSWRWDFGDGTGSGGNSSGNFTGGTPYPTHAYASFGSYVVTLVITDNAGLTASANHTLYVNAPPVAVITPSRSVGKVGTSVVFSANASHDPDDRITAFAWRFSDGSTASGPWVVHVFASPGTYDVSLLVLDAYNATGFAELSYAVILPKSPVSVMAWSPSRPVTGQTVTFDGSNSLDPDGVITTYIWEFGDGTVGHGRTAAHNYTDAGTYTIELVVLDEDGFSNRDVQTITVLARSKGTVVAASAAIPIGGARITLTQGGAVALETTTATDGTFSLGNTAPGTYAIRIVKDGYEPYSGTIVWDGLHGDLGVWRLTPLSVQPNGFPVEALSMVGLAIIIATLIAVMVYVRVRKAGRGRRET